jgi:hypothetical protein
MHKHKLHYDVQTCQVKIGSIKIDQIVAIKEQMLLALASTLITARYKGKVDKDRMYIASFLHQKPQISWESQQLFPSTKKQLQNHCLQLCPV